MYYKITNKDSKVYKQLFELRKKEITLEELNLGTIIAAVGDDWDDSLGNAGQQNYQRVTQYRGFAFKHPERLPKKTWKKHKEYQDIYVPNPRTVNGRRMRDFLNNMPHSSVVDVFEILGCKLGGPFNFPYVHICKDDVIVLFMGDRYYDELSKNPDIIEITKREFDELNVD